MADLSDDREKMTLAQGVKLAWISSSQTSFIFDYLGA